jgi:hypothetical protein
VTILLDPLAPLGLEQLAELGGKTYSAAWAWWSRTQAGTARDPLPPKDGGTDKHPMWLYRTVKPALLRARWITQERPQMPAGTRLRITQEAEPFTFFPPGCFDDVIGEEVTLDVQGAPRGTGRIAAAKVAPGGRSVNLTIELTDQEGQEQ